MTNSPRPDTHAPRKSDCSDRHLLVQAQSFHRQIKQARALSSSLSSAAAALRSSSPQTSAHRFPTQNNNRNRAWFSKPGASRTKLDFIGDLKCFKNSGGRPLCFFYQPAQNNQAGGGAGRSLRHGVRTSLTLPPKRSATGPRSQRVKSRERVGNDERDQPWVRATGGNRPALRDRVKLRPAAAFQPKIIFQPASPANIARLMMTAPTLPPVRPPNPGSS